MGDLVHFQGLRELDRALGRADKTLRKGLRDDLRRAGEIVATEARSIIEDKGLVESGDLLRSVRPFAYAGRAGVQVTARHRGYRYPSRLEFEGRDTGGVGPRAFLAPAVDAKAEQVTEALEHLLDDVADDLGR